MITKGRFTPKMFHLLCDGKPKTITVIKVKEQKKFLVGIIILWHGIPMTNGVNVKKSFIFSFTTNKNNEFFNDIIFGNIKYAEHALYYNSCYSLAFGNEFNDFGKNSFRN